jgi:hypothetical protein
MAVALARSPAVARVTLQVLLSFVILSPSALCEPGSILAERFRHADFRGRLVRLAASAQRGAIDVVIGIGDARSSAPPPHALIVHSLC